MASSEHICLNSKLFFLFKGIFFFLKVFKERIILLFKNPFRCLASAKLPVLFAVSKKYRRNKYGLLMQSPPSRNFLEYVTVEITGGGVIPESPADFHANFLCFNCFMWHSAYPFSERA